MTLEEAAKRLGVTADTLRQQIGRGKLAAVKHGPIWWVTPGELDRYAREHRLRGRPGPRKSKEG